MKLLNHHRRMAAAALGAVCVFTWNGSATRARAEDYQGAAVVLRQAAQASQTRPKDEKASPGAQLRADLKVFKQQSAALAPDEAAKQWLALADRFSGLGEPSANFFGGNAEELTLEPGELLEALPPPAAWPALGKAVEARPPGEGVQVLHELGLRLLVHALTGEAAKRRDDLAALEGLAAKARANQSYFYNSLLEELSSSIVALQDNPEALLQTLESKVAAQQSREGYQSDLEVPDLVALVGPEKAETFLRHALVKSKAKLNIETATATGKLARKLALELVNEMKTPQWLLVNSLDAADLYEAMEKRFAPPGTNGAPVMMPGLPAISLPAETPDDYRKQTAHVYYLLGLIAHGRTAQAVQVAKEFEKANNVYFPEEVVRQMERGGFTGQLNDFFHDQLQQNPELPFWGEYVQLAAHAGQSAEMVKLVRAAIAKTDLSKSQRMQLQQLLYQALLANDEVEAGVAELRRLIQTNRQSVVQQRNYRREDSGGLGLVLAQAGRLLNRPDWQEEGIAVAKEAVQQPAAQDYSSCDGSTALLLARFLADLNRGPEAEAVLSLSLSNAVVLQQGQEPGSYMEQNSPAPQILGALAQLYHRAGRDADVLQLFDQAPNWGAKDLIELNPDHIDLEEMLPSFSHKHTPVPVGYYAASALGKTGHPAEARKLLDALFIQSPGCDRLYELLLTLADDQTVPADLDALFARDQFEERPLIWKAHWLRLHQRLEEAEQAARKAIAIDPTDGEEGPGDRLRAYAELAEIRAARGDTNEAATLRGAVAAVHEAEQADQFNNVGLIKRAVAMYQDSLGQFANAYCIHARLAVQLSSLGLHEEAEKHYQRAYELMPDSFGRMESYCFGCEGAFKGEQAQGIAEKVFARLARKTPDKPQVHYLLGYLRDEEGRYPEALASYRTAVKLDPDYLNAWEKIECLNRHVFMPAAERDAVIFNLLRLDPQGEHASLSYEEVSDLAALWHNVAAAAEKRPAEPESLRPLSASKMAVEKREQQAKEQGRMQGMETRFNFHESQEAMTPGKAVAQNGFIQAAQKLLGREAAGAIEE